MLSRDFRLTVIISTILALLFGIGAFFLTATNISDDEIEVEKQSLYEVKDNTPKDVEQAIGKENLEITCSDTITYTFKSDNCSLVVVYDTEYNVIEETFKDLRSNIGIRICLSILFGALGIAVGMLITVIWLVIEEVWDDHEYARLKRKRARQAKRQNKNQEKEKKKAEKQRAMEVKVIQQ